MIRMITLSAFLLLAGCSYTPQPQNLEEGSGVGATGDLSFTHEALGNDKHILTITAAPGLLETEGSIAQRIHILSNRFAARTCSKSYEFIHDPNFDQSIASGFFKRTKSYVFLCKS